MYRLFFLAVGVFAMGCEDYLFAVLLPGLSESLRSSAATVGQGCTLFSFASVLSIPLCVFWLSKKPAGHVLIGALDRATGGMAWGGYLGSNGDGIFFRRVNFYQAIFARGNTPTFDERATRSVSKSPYPGGGQRNSLNRNGRTRSLYLRQSSIKDDKSIFGGRIFSVGIRRARREFAVAHILDRFGNPQSLMAVVLSILFIAMMSIPILSQFRTLAFIPFFIWGAMAWSSVTLQQQNLFNLKSGHESIFVALNSSAVCLGAAFGSAFGGMTLASGLHAYYLPYVMSASILGALIFQMHRVYNSVQNKKVAPKTPHA